MLTQRQLELLKFIQQYSALHHVSPSYDEMRKHLNLKSKSAVHALISSLVSKGYLERLPNQARALKIVKFTEISSVQNQQTFRGDNVLEGGKINETLNIKNENLVSVSFHGDIAAGMPLTVFENPDETIEIPDSFFVAGNKENYFALRIVGQSMIEAGILDGDIVIMLKTNKVTCGDIVAALVDSDEVTLKRLRVLESESDKVCLEAANRDFVDQVYHSSRVVIIGKLAHLVRKY